MDEKKYFIIIIVISLCLYLREWYKRRDMECKLDRMVRKLEHFLLNGERNLSATLEEGRIENLQNQLSNLEEQFYYQLLKEKEEKQRVNHFMENMAHQMKTPLTALQIRIDLAEQAILDEKGKKEVKECQKCMERLSGEVDRILKGSQLANKTVFMQFQRWDISQMIQDTIRELNPILIKRAVVIETDFSKGMTAYVDGYWFSQALENILKNAVEHSQKGSCVRIEITDEISRLIFRVKDEGKGIKEADLPYLFERFYRGSHAKAGYGIGLSMARDIVEAHHGTLTVRNRQVRGACFQIELPILDGTKPYEAVSWIVSGS